MDCLEHLMGFITDAGMSSHGAVRQPLLCPPHHYQQSSHPSLLLLGAPGAAEQLSGVAAASCVLMHLHFGSTIKTTFADVPGNKSLATMPMT